MANPPAYQYYAADFDEDTATWTNGEVGVYQRLLNYSWINGWTPNEGLPDDPRRLCKIARCSYKKFTKRWTIIKKKFSPNGNGFLVNRRLEEGRSKLLKYIELQREKGIEGAKTRWGDDSCGHSTGHNHGHSPSNGRKVALPSSSSLKKEKDMQVSPALLFPLKDGTDYPLELAKISEYEKTYHNIDVQFELKKCLQWDIDRPEQRKTSKGILKHINHWLSVASQSKGPPIQAGIDPDNTAVDEARKDMKKVDMDKTRENIARINKMGVGVTKNIGG